MSVTRYAPINLAGVALAAHPVHYICTTTAELPSSGLKLGDTALTLDTNLQYKAASASLWSLASAGGATSTLVVKAADESVTSSTTLQADNDLFFPMAANEVWLVTATLLPDSASATPGIKLGMTLPAGATARWSFGAQWGSNLPIAASTQSSTIATPLTASSANTTDPTMFRYLVINAGTAGNFQLTWAQNVSNATATFVRRYSMLAALKLA